MSDINVNTGKTNDSNFDWKKYQKQDAKEAAVKNNLEAGPKGLIGMLLATMDTAIAKELTNICNQMAETYDGAIADEVEYEIEEETRSLEEIEKELEEVQDRIKELSEKQENGTITEDEQAELESLDGKSGDLKSELNDAIKEEHLWFLGFKEKAEEQKSVSETAEKYSDTTIDVGEDVVNKYEKKSQRFFAKLFKKTFDEQKEIGNNAIDSGTNLASVIQNAEKMADAAEEAINSAENVADDAQSIADALPSVETDTVPDENEDKDKKDKEEEK